LELFPALVCDGANLRCRRPSGFDPGYGMKPLPRDPYAFQARVMDALIRDILDPQATKFPRCDALRAVTRRTK
jgi:hypothetical protein